MAPHQPARLGRLLRRLWRLGSRRQEVEADLGELFAARTADRGVRHARRRYLADALSLWRHRSRDVQGPHFRPARILSGFTTDVVFAGRLFKRQPGIVGMTVTGLAVAIGVSTAVLTLVNAAAFRASGIKDEDRVFRVLLADEGMRETPWSYPDYQEICRRATSVDVVASAWGAGEASFRDRDDVDRGTLPRISVMPVTGNYFPVLGIHAAVGRLLTPEDDTPGAPRALVLAYVFWQEQFGGDTSILGRTVWVADSAFTVVGVAARGFEPPGHGGAIPISAWMPLAVNVETAREARDSQVRIAKSEMAVLARKVRLSPAEKARLDVLTAEVATPRPIVDQNRLLVRTKPGVARDQAEAELTSFAAALAARRGPSAGERPPIVRLQSVGALDTSDLWLIGLVTTPAILLVVLAGANVANLLLASAAGRWREIGTRRALGASRARVTRQLLTESVLLGCLGGAAGLVLSLWLAPGLAALVHLPADIDVSPNLAVYLCATAVTLVVATAAGMASARHSGRDDLTSALKSDQVGAPGAWRPGRLRSLLVGGQAAASIVLLVVAALCTRSVVRAVTYDHGADIDRLVDVDLTPGRGLDPAARRMLGENVLARIRRIPGVENVARADFTPFSRGGALATLGADRMHRQVFRNSTSAGYFDTIGARVLRGRTYSEEEVRTGAPVAVITESLARDFWGPDNPIGASLERLWGPDDPVGTRPDDWTRKPAGTRVIGVVEETTMGLWQLGLPIIYLPLPRDSALHFVVRVSPDREPAALVGALHEALEALDADLSRTILLPTDLYREELEYPKMLAFLGAFVGFTALALAMVGLFGVTAFAVVQRRHEVSVRLALGANRGQVIRMLVREALKPVLIGLVCGLGLSFFFTDQVTRGYLMGISPRDPVAMIAAVTILLIAASVAAFAPARQAARVDPSVMLKQS